MALRTYPDMEQRSPEWYAARCGIVTASAVGQLITSKTLQPADNDYSRGLTALLVAERITGQVDETPISSDMWRGIEHEPYAVEKYAECYAPVTPMGFMRREEKGWTLGYSPDALVGAHGLVEVKCPRAKTHLRTILADEVPAHHMPQLQGGLLASGRLWIDYVSFCAGMPMYRKRVYPDARWFRAIREAVSTFETNAAQMVAAYQEATKTLPATERIDLEIRI